MRPSFIFILALASISFLAEKTAASDPATVVALWKGPVPGDQQELGEEKDTTKPNDHLVADKSVIRLGNVSNPTIAVHRPPPAKHTGAAVLVCPGGGYNIL